MALGDGIRRNIATTDPAERAMLRHALARLNQQVSPATRTDSPEFLRLSYSNLNLRFAIELSRFEPSADLQFKPLSPRVTIQPSTRLSLRTAPDGLCGGGTPAGDRSRCLWCLNADCLSSEPAEARRSLELPRCRFHRRSEVCVTKFAAW